MRSITRGWRGLTMQNTPGATPLPRVKSTTPERERMPPSSFVQSTCASTSRSAWGPCMPGTSGTRPVALASAVISTMVLEPSTNSTSMRGFMLRAFASAANSSGTASGLKALFFALPAQTISKPRDWAKPISSTVAAGSSPAAPVSTTPALRASCLRKRPMVMSASTLSSTTCLPLWIASSDTSVPMFGLPVASITTSICPAAHMAR